MSYDLSRIDNKISNWGDDSQSWDHWKSFITIQIRTYANKNVPTHMEFESRFKIETEHYAEIYNIFKSNKYYDNDIKDQISYILEYSKNPAIFIGSILGYIDFEKWNSMSKMKLFNIQIQNKAINDIYREKKEYEKWF